MSIKESGEMYLETILILSKEKNAVRAIDIAGHMGISKPSVSRALGKLKNEAFVLVDHDGSITFTEAGRAIAETIYERHRVLTDLFTSIGVDQETAADDACRVEHYISDTTFKAIKGQMSEYKKAEGAKAP